MKDIRIHFEGDDDLREGFKTFLTGIEEPGVVKVSVIAGGSNAETRKMFEKARTMHPQSTNVLLIDSEGELPAHHRRDNRRFYMVRCMESWFLADRAAHADFYGSRCFQMKPLPGRAEDVESISKEDVLKGLHSASHECRNGGYKRNKVLHGNSILARISAERFAEAHRNVRDSSQH